MMPSVCCTQCGHANPDGARFCMNCGTPLGEDVPPVGDQGDSTSTMSLGAIEAAVECEQGEESAADQMGVESLPSNAGLLLVRRGPNAGSRFLLDRDIITVGRHPESDIFLDDVTVSRRHAEFHRHVGRFSVRDVGSLNGTYTNRERIDEIALSSGDEVQIGRFRLAYLGNAAGGVAAVSSPPERRSRRGLWGRWRR